MINSGVVGGGGVANGVVSDPGGTVQWVANGGEINDYYKWKENMIFEVNRYLVIEPNAREFNKYLCFFQSS
jgi:hypothetical protein